MCFAVLTTGNYSIVDYSVYLHLHCITGRLLVKCHCFRFDPEHWLNNNFLCIFLSVHHILKQQRYMCVQHQRDGCVRCKERKVFRNLFVCIGRFSKYTHCSCESLVTDSTSDVSLFTKRRYHTSLEGVKEVLPTVHLLSASCLSRANLDTCHHWHCQWHITQWMHSGKDGRDKEGEISRSDAQRPHLLLVPCLLSSDLSETLAIQGQNQSVWRPRQEPSKQQQNTLTSRFEFQTTPIQCSEGDERVVVVNGAFSVNINRQLLEMQDVYTSQNEAILLREFI